jgi:hypothetical protein
VVLDGTVKGSEFTDCFVKDGERYS